MANNEKLEKDNSESEISVEKKDVKAKKKNKKEDSKDKPSRGIETWFRLTSRNLYTRRQIVDTKANILLTINSVNLSILLGATYNQIDSDPHLAASVVPLISSSLISIIFTIIAIRPKVGQGRASKKEIKRQCVSLMTFDNFYQMSIDEYRKSVDKLMKNKDLLYGSIETDVYRLGVDLSHRYLYIQRAYNTFLFGIIISVLVFVYLKILA